MFQTETVRFNCVDKSSVAARVTTTAKDALVRTAVHMEPPTTSVMLMAVTDERHAESARPGAEMLQPGPPINMIWFFNAQSLERHRCAASESAYDTLPAAMACKESVNGLPAQDVLEKYTASAQLM
jgi:hypothetical protein